jgi:rSAM/selenodomain-associated transferase 2
MPDISVIVPVLNEAGTIQSSLKSLRQSQADCNLEIIVVDGGSIDATLQVAAPLCEKLISSQRGRAVQMNAGAQEASGHLILFLHADTQLPEQVLPQIIQQLSQYQKVWGRFDVRLSGAAFMFRIIGQLINWRSRLTGIATGDQAIFVRKDVFEALGGFENLPLMEDIVLSRKLKKQYGRPLCSSQRVITSSRRWEQNGIWRTIFLMWRLRLAFFLGADPQKLAEKYSS